MQEYFALALSLGLEKLCVRMTIDSPLHVDGTAKVQPCKAPAIGQHTDEILREAGYDADEIAKLRTGNVLG